MFYNSNNNLINFILDFIYPQYCLKCGQHFPVITNQFYCSDCLLENIKFINPPYCYKCGKKVLDEFENYVEEEKKIICKDCKENKIYFDSLRSVVFYEDIIKELIHFFKYKGYTNLKKFLSLFIITYLTEDSFYKDKQFDYIIPVPLHKTKYEERGFNQTLLIAKEVSKVLKIPVLDNYLIRIKKTESQFNLKRSERIENIKGAFDVENEKKLTEKKILLIDDISTTNITINECSKILKEKGSAKRIDTITIAHGR
ncbi:MAG TPA: ComF family protein [bacterium]|nr:ComF family protein [bacterium]HOL47402.1 ComF family protein [bacterium]HPQ18571.1 ComF family protein [bacterium]